MNHALGPYKHEVVPTPGPDGQPAGYAVLIYPEAKIAAPEPGAEPVNMAVAVVTFFADVPTTMANARLFTKAPQMYMFLRAYASMDDRIGEILDYIDNGEVQQNETVQGSTGSPDGSAPAGS